MHGDPNRNPQVPCHPGSAGDQRGQADASLVSRHRISRSVASDAERPRYAVEEVDNPNCGSSSARLVRFAPSPRRAAARRSKNAAMRNRSICLGLVSYIVRFIQNAVNLRSA
jgi:hypothetical protein